MTSVKAVRKCSTWEGLESRAKRCQKLLKEKDNELNILKTKTGELLKKYKAKVEEFDTIKMHFLAKEDELNNIEADKLRLKELLYNSRLKVKKYVDLIHEKDKQIEDLLKEKENVNEREIPVLQKNVKTYIKIFQENKEHKNVSKEEHFIPGYVDGDEVLLLKTPVKPPPEFVTLDDEKDEQAVPSLEEHLSFEYNRRVKGDQVVEEQDRIKQNKVEEKKVIKLKMVGKISRSACTVCEEVFLDSAMLKKHIKENHLQLDGKCKQCEFSFSSQTGLQQHIKKIHVPTKYMDESETQIQRLGCNLMGENKGTSEKSGLKKLEAFQQLISSKLSLNTKDKDDFPNNPENAVEPIKTKQNTRLGQPIDLNEKPSSPNIIAKEEPKENPIIESQTSKTKSKTVATYSTNLSSTMELPGVFNSRFKGQDKIIKSFIYTPEEQNYRHTDGKLVVSCKICRKEGSYAIISNHIKAKHIEGIEYACDKCGKFFGSRFNIREHQKVHNVT